MHLEGDEVVASCASRLRKLGMACRRRIQAVHCPAELVVRKCAIFNCRGRPSHRESSRSSIGLTYWLGVINRQYCVGTVIAGDDPGANAGYDQSQVLSLHIRHRERRTVAKPRC